MGKFRIAKALVVLVALARAGWGLELGILPPTGNDEVATAVRTVAAEVGVTVSVLEPAQLIDRARMSPGVYRLLILIGADRYPDTVIDEGDAAAALQAYVDAGGSLLVIADSQVMSRPQRWTGAEWKSFPAPLRRVALQTRFGLLDAGQRLETVPPAGSEYVVGPESPLAGRLPERFPRSDDGAPYGPVPSSQEAAISFTPLATLVDPQGGTYGAGLARMRRNDVPSAGSVFYAWAPLLTSERGRAILLGVLALDAEHSLDAAEKQRQAELLEQIGQLEARHAAAKAILPDDLHNPDVDGLRAELEQLAGTLRWLREAAAVGNLNFVAIRLGKLREELLDLPQRVGLAVDNAVLDQVAQPTANAPGPPAAPPRVGEIEPGGGGEVMAAAEVAPPAVSPQPGLPSPASPPEPAMREEPATAAPVLTADNGTPPTETAPAAPPATAAGEATPAGPTEPIPPDTTARDTTEPAPYPEAKGPVVAIEVANRGTVVIELFPAVAPKTVSAFLYLVRDGFYERTYFHRRFEKFVVQGGDPYTRTLPPDHELVGTGGPEWTVPLEVSPEAKHERGAVGLARAPSDPNSGGSQFYICLEAQPDLDGKYCVFGKVIAGMDVVDKIQVGDKVTAARVVQGAEPKNREGAGPLEQLGTP